MKTETFWTRIKNSFKNLMGSRMVEGGTQFLVVFVLVTGILVLVNLISSNYEGGWWRIDVTKNKLFSLSEKTREVLKGMPEEREINIAAFFQEPRSRQQVQDLLKEYDSYSDQVNVEIVDVVNNPMRVKASQITQESLEVVSGEQRQILTSFEEEDITNAILQVLSLEQKKIYFVTGHNEYSPEKGYASFAKLLQDENYLVEAFTSLGKQAVPEDADVIIVNEADMSWNEEEITLLKDYVEKGGNLLLLLRMEGDNNFDPLLSEWGIDSLDLLVVDAKENFFGDASFISTQNFGYHTIAEELGVVVMPTVKGLRQQEEVPAQVSLTKLVQSGENSWGESDIPAPGQTDYQLSFKEEEGDQEGPLTISFAGEIGGGEDEKGRFIVVGDADFASDMSMSVFGAVIDLGSNKDFILNSVAWLARLEKLVTIRPKEISSEPIVLSGGQQSLILWATSVIYPLIVLSFGLFVWYRRRKR